MRDLIKVILINAVIFYIGSALINAYFDYRDFHKSYFYGMKSEIEAEARIADKKYYKSCLSESYTQIFYPNLIQPNTHWLEMAEKYEFLPLGSQPNSLVSYCNEGYGFVKYKTDRFGFRNVDNLWDKEVDVLLVGDSFVQGACVDNDKYISAQMNQSDASLVSINVGSSSNGPQHYNVLLKKFVPISGAKNVVLVFYPNDNYGSALSNPYVYSTNDLDRYDYHIDGTGHRGRLFFDQAKKYLRDKDISEKETGLCEIPEDYYLEYNNKSISNSLRWESKFISFSALLPWLKGKENVLSDLLSFAYTINKYNEFNSKDEIKISKVPMSTIYSIDVLAEICKDNCNPFVAFVPNSIYWRPDARANNYFDGINSYIKSKPSASSIEVVDFRMSILSHQAKFYSPVGPHLSDYSYKIISDELMKVIQRN